jgi:Domain of unknown function (DUF4440)
MLVFKLVRNMVATGATLLATIVPVAKATAQTLAKAMDGVEVNKVILDDETASWQAWVGDRVNIPEAQRFLAPDFVDIDASGAMWTASQEFEQMKYCGISSFKILDPQVRLLSRRSAAITYRVDVNAHCGEQQISEELFASSVWIKRGKQWLTEVHTETVAAAKK